jgi:preprotein translocase subunit SecF
MTNQDRVVKTTIKILKIMTNTKFTLWTAILGLVIIIGLMFGIPKYNVWRAEMKGKAEFARAEQNRVIRIEEARANLEAERLNAEAEVIRARGAAEAIEIEGGKLTENYIRYLWVRQQGDLNNKTVIYIPTEAGLPILEANRNK